MVPFLSHAPVSCFSFSAIHTNGSVRLDHFVMGIDSVIFTFLAGRPVQDVSRACALSIINTEYGIAKNPFNCFYALDLAQ